MGIKISNLPSATLPLTGSELVPVVQSGVTSKAQIFDLLSGSNGSASVGFVQSGTGATSRTTQAKLRDVVSVKDFGAVGDGVTDDTAALQLAFNAINGTGKTLLLQKHRITATCTAPTNATISGGEINVQLTGANWDLSAAISIEEVENLTIDGVTFNGLSASSGSIFCNAIYIDYAWPGNTPSKNIKITNCIFNRLTGFGIAAQPIGGSGWTIANNTFVLEGAASTKRTAGGVSTEGVSAAMDLVFNTGNTYVDGLIFSNNNIIIDTSTQVYHGVSFKIQGAKNSSISGNNVTLLGSNGIFNHSSGFCELHLKSSNVVGNSFADPLNIAITTCLAISGCQNTTFSNNVVNGINIAIISYTRSSPAVQTSNLIFDGFSGTAIDPSNLIAAYCPVIFLSSGFTNAGIEVTNFTGSIANLCAAASTNIAVRNSRIKAMMFPNSITLARAAFFNCVFNPVTISQSNTIVATNRLYLQNSDIYFSDFYGTASMTGGDYIVEPQNTRLVNNRYINVTGGNPTGAVFQAINTGAQIISGSDTDIIEDVNSFINFSSKQFAVYTSGAYQKTTVGTATPVGAKWVRGDYVWNLQPTAAGYLGWTCVTSGYAVKGAWTTGAAYIIGDWVSNAGKIYRATTAGTAGATAPTHTSGTQSDGGVTWLFVATSATAAFKGGGLIET